MRLKLSKYYLFFFVNQLNFIIESIDAFYFVNNGVVHKALLVKEKGGNVVYKLFIVNVVSMHLSATWQFWPFQRLWTGIFWGRGGLWIELQEGVEVAQVGGKSPGVGGSRLLST